MGWLTSRKWTKQTLVERLTASEEKNGIVRTCLKHSLKGNVLWTVWEISFPYKPTTRFIGCDLLSNSSRGEWGYKDMDESCGPYYYTCPISFFKLVPVANQQWRDEVLKLDALKKANLRIDDQLVLDSGYTVTYLRKGVKQGSLIVCLDGQHYTVQRSRVTQILSVH